MAQALNLLVGFLAGVALTVIVLGLMAACARKQAGKLR